MQEVLKKVANEVMGPMERMVTLCISSKPIQLNGTWSWDMQSSALYCSDAMSFPEDFVGTKSIVHPDDMGKLTAALSLLEDKDLVRLDFRIITTYGEVKTISGQRVSIRQTKKDVAEPVPGKEPWEEILQQIATQRENDFLQIRSVLVEYTERLNGIGSWLLNKDTGQAWYSDNAFRLYGVAPQSLNAHANTFSHFVHKDDRMAVLDAFEKAYANHTPLHIEYRVITADGETRHIQQITRWFYNDSGQQLLGGALRDVTEERNLLDELSSAQSHTLLYKHVLNLSELKGAMAYWVINLASRKATYSENYYRIYGLKQVTLPSYNSFVNFVHADDRQKVREVVDEMFNQHTLPEIEFRIVRPDGKIRFLNQAGKVFVTQNKELVMVGLVHDISVQKGLEKKMSELGETIAMNNIVAEMTEQAAEVTSFTWMPDGYMHWSDGFYRFLGYKPGGIEPLPRILYRNIHASDLKAFRDAESLLLNHQNHDDIHIRFVSKGGIRQAKVSFRRVDAGKEIIIALVQDITKQKELEQQVTHNKLYGDLVAESVTDMVLFTNVDHTILHWNKVAEEKTGILKEDALHQNLFDVLPRLNEPDFLGQLHLAARGTEFHGTRIHTRYIRKAQDYWLWPLKNDAGEVQGVLHVVQDVSRQLELQQQLGERLNFIESLVESAVDRIVVLDRFMNYLYWNKKAEQYYAIKKERVLGKNILEIFPALRNDPTYQQFRAVLKGETVYLPPVADEETNEYFEAYLIPIKDENGDVSAVLWVVHDLSREYELTKDRNNTANLLHATLDASQDMIQVFEAVRDEDGEIVDFTWVLTNHEAEKWMPDVVGKSLLEQQPGVVQEGIFDSFKQVVETGVPHQGERHYVHEQFDGWFYQSTVKLNDGVATTTRDITARKNAEQEVLYLKDEKAQTATEKYYSIFNSIDEGFCIIELIFDEDGKVVDYWHREHNPVFTRMTGIKDAVGKRMSELAPHLENEWHRILEKIYYTGESIKIEYPVQQLDQWYSAYLTRVGGEGSRLIACVYDEITERKRNEQRQEFLLKLSDALRLTSNATEIEGNVTSLTMDYLGTDRCYYSRIENDHAIIRNDSRKPGLPSLAGAYPLHNFPILSGVLDKLKPCVVEDVPNSGFDSSLIELCIQLEIFSFAAVPVIKNNKVVGSVSITQSSPRQWKEHEINLISDTAERLWAAVERANAEEALRKSEEKYRALFNSIDDGFQIYEVLYDDAGKPIDFRYLETNPAFEQQTGLKNVAGKLGSEVIPNLENYWLDYFDKILKSPEPLHVENYNEATGRWYSVSSFRASNDRPLIAALFTDITERKLREEQLSKDLADTIHLQQVSSALLEAKDSDSLYVKIMDAAQAIMQSDMASIQMFVPEKNALKLIGHKNFHPESAKLWEWVGADASSVCGMALAENKRIIVRDIETEFIKDADALNVFRLSGSRAVQSTPLISRSGNTIGMFSTHWTKIHEPSERDLRLLDVLARQAADLLEKKQAEHGLRQSEDKLKQWNASLEQEVIERTIELQKQLTLLRHTENLAQSGSWEYEIKTGDFKWSEGMYKIFGLPQQMKVRPEIYLEFALEEDRSIAKKIVNHFKKKHEPFEEILRIKTNEEVHTLKIKSSVLHDSKNRPEKIIGVDVDVTDVRKAEQKLSESRHWLE